MHKERETTNFWPRIRGAHMVLYVFVMLVVMGLGAYENFLSLSQWLSGLAFQYDVSVTGLLAREFTTGLTIYALYSVLCFFGFWPLFGLSRRFEFPNGSFYDKQTFIYYRKQIDYDKINEGFKRGARACLLLLAILLPMFLLWGSVVYIAAFVAGWLMLTGIVKVLSGKRQRDGDVSYYPQSEAFRDIAMDAFVGGESNEVMIKKIDDLPSDCPDLKVATLMKRKLLGEKVTMPFSHYGFGTPELDEEERQAFAAVDEDPVRRG